MEKINEIKLEDFKDFNGGWSLAPIPTFFTLKNVNFDKTLNILEFGSGQGTTNIVNFLNSKNVDFNYTSVENDKSYAKTEGVEYILYDIPNNYEMSHIDNVDLPLSLIYDLVIVDGPTGVGRAGWYKKIKNNVRPGTTIYVDDFHHYSEFGTELDNSFEYELISLYNKNSSFEIVNEGIDVVSENTPYIFDKSYKIVKIKNIK
jgi:hypothetical protein